MINFISVYIATLIPLLLIDAVWLIVMAPKLYRTHMAHLMSDTPKLIPAAIFYVLYALGITLFVILPGIENKYNTIKILAYGGLFGLIAYGTYDLTNHATLKNWPAIITITDLMWGTVLTGVVSIIAINVVKLWQ